MEYKISDVVSYDDEAVTIDLRKAHANSAFRIDNFNMGDFSYSAAPRAGEQEKEENYLLMDPQKWSGGDIVFSELEKDGSISKNTVSVTESMDIIVTGLDGKSEVFKLQDMSQKDLDKMLFSADLHTQQKLGDSYFAEAAAAIKAAFDPKALETEAVAQTAPPTPSQGNSR